MTDNVGPIETRPGPQPEEQKGLITDAAVAFGVNAAWAGVKVVGGQVIDHLRPSAQQPNVPPSGGEAPGGADTSPDWNWPAR